MDRAVRKLWCEIVHERLAQSADYRAMPASAQREQLFQLLAEEPETTAEQAVEAVDAVRKGEPPVCSDENCRPKCCVPR